MADCVSRSVWKEEGGEACDVPSKHDQSRKKRFVVDPAVASLVSLACWDAGRVLPASQCAQSVLVSLERNLMACYLPSV